MTKFFFLDHIIYKKRKLIIRNIKVQGGNLCTKNLETFKIKGNFYYIFEIQLLEK